MVAPLVAGAVIGGISSIAGGILGGKGQKKAAKEAAKAQLKATQMNNALAREIYGKNALRLDPYAQRGNQAGNVLQELLLGPAPAGSTGTTGGYASTLQPNTPEYAAAAMQALLPHLTNNDNPDRGYATAYRSYASAHPIQYAQGGGIDPTWATGALQAVLPHVTANAQNNPDRGISQAWTNFVSSNPEGPAPMPAASTGSALSAWDQFRNSTNYQFRYGQGLEALDQGAAARGALDSGAARKAELEYGQNFASNELGAWMDRLAVQQGTGLSAASALAGVGQNFVGQVSANNNSAADAASNAALISGNANANMWANIGSGVGAIAGALGSSFGGGGSGGSRGPWSYGEWG